MTEKIIALLLDICGADEGEIQADTELFAEGILDSFGLVQLLVELESQLGISLDPASLDREAIGTPARLAAAAQAAQ